MNRLRRDENGWYVLRAPSRRTATILAFTLGGLGAHHFYLGDTGRGLLSLAFSWTLVPAALGIANGFELSKRGDEDWFVEHGERMSLDQRSEVIVPVQ